MPIHDFQCPKCGKITEEILPQGVSYPFRCPDCKVLVEKLISPVNFKFVKRVQKKRMRK